MCDSSRHSSSFHTHSVGILRTLFPQAQLPSLAGSKLVIYSFSHSHSLALEKLPGDNLNHIWRMSWWLSFMSSPLNIRTDSSSHFFLRLFVSEPLSEFDPEMFCGIPLPLPPSLPPSLPAFFLQSRHPHQHVSGAVWVSIYATSNKSLSSDWNAFEPHLFSSFLPSPSSPYIPTTTKPWVHCMLPVCLPEPLAQRATRTLTHWMLTVTFFSSL